MADSKLSLLPKGFSYEIISCVVKERRFEEIEKWLRKYGVLSNEERLESYEDVTQWSRKGAESYVSDARIITSNGRKVHFIVKAIVGMLPIDERICELIERRKLLRSLGIPIPELFGINCGAVIEAFIPKDLLSQRGVLPLIAKLKIARIAAILDCARFSVLNFLSDLRCSEDLLDVFYVDFGFDLGMPGLQLQTHALKQIESQFSLDVSYPQILGAYHCISFTQN